MYICVMACL